MLAGRSDSRAQRRGLHPMGLRVACLPDRASRAFPDLEFNFHLSDEEVEETVSEAEADVSAEVFSGAPDRAPSPDPPCFCLSGPGLWRLCFLF